MEFQFHQSWEISISQFGNQVCSAILQNYEILVLQLHLYSINFPLDLVRLKTKHTLYYAMLLSQVALTSHIVLIEKLDEKEFGEAAASRTYDESAANSAVELDLLVTKPNFRKSILWSSTCFKLLY